MGRISWLIRARCGDGWIYGVAGSLSRTECCKQSGRNIALLDVTETYGYHIRSGEDTNASRATRVQYDGYRMPFYGE